MTIEFFVNKERGFVYIKPKGVVSLQEMVDHQSMMANHADFDPEGLGMFDFSDMTLTGINFNLMAEITKSDPCERGFRRAIVAPRTAVYGMALMFQTLAGEKHGRIKAFRELSEAKKWLGVEEKDFLFSHDEELSDQEKTL